VSGTIPNEYSALSVDAGGSLTYAQLVSLLTHARVIASYLRCRSLILNDCLALSGTIPSALCAGSSTTTQYANTDLCCDTVDC
jgi:hypothetical protein